VTIRREFIGALAAPLAAEAQPADRIYRIGFLSPLSGSETDRQDAFRQGMRETGYVEGRDFVVEGCFAEGYPLIPDSRMRCGRIQW